MKSRSGIIPSFGLDLPALPRWPLITAIGTLIVLSLLYLSLAFLGLLEKPETPTTEAVPRAAHVTVGGLDLLVPQDLIRFDHQKRDGVQERLDLAVPWQENNVEPTLIFVSITPKDEALAPPLRVSSVYKRFLTSEIDSGPSNLAMRKFKDNTGYDDETLVYDPQNPGGYFVRCAPQAEGQPPMCIREIRIADKIDVVYRFPQTLLADWTLLEQNVNALLGAVGVNEEP